MRNAIVTGALGTDTSNPPYGAVADITSRGPSQVDTPSGTINVGDMTPYGVFQGRAATDQATRAKTYQEASALINDDV